MAEPSSVAETWGLNGTADPETRARLEAQLADTKRREEAGEDTGRRLHVVTDAGGVAVPSAQAVRWASTTRASEIEPENVVWLWQGRLPLGMLSLMPGEEGLGKGTISAWTIARITRGELPGAYKDRPQDVLAIMTEDTRQHVIVPRLTAAETDLERVHFMDVHAGEHPDALVLPRDTALVREQARAVGARLVYLDPFSSFLDPEFDSYNASQARAQLTMFVGMLEDEELAALGVWYVNKNESSDSPRSRTSESYAYRAAARSTLILGLDPDDPTGDQGPSRVLATDKHNLGPPTASLRFRIEQAEFERKDGKLIRTSRAVAGEECWLSARDVLGASKAHAKAKKLLDAMTFLRAELPELVPALKEKAKEKDISWRTVERAKSLLNVESERQGTKKTDPYRWTLPDGHDKPAF